MELSLELVEIIIIVILGIIAIVSAFNGQLELETTIAGGLLGFVGANFTKANASDTDGEA